MFRFSVSYIRDLTVILTMLWWDFTKHVYSTLQVWSWVTRSWWSTARWSPTWTWYSLNLYWLNPVPSPWLCDHVDVNARVTPHCSWTMRIYTSTTWCARPLPHSQGSVIRLLGNLLYQRLTGVSDPMWYIWYLICTAWHSSIVAD